MLCRHHHVALLDSLLAVAPPVFAQPAAAVRESDVVLDTIAISDSNERVVFNPTA